MKEDHVSCLFKDVRITKALSMERNPLSEKNQTLSSYSVLFRLRCRHHQLLFK